MVPSSLGVSPETEVRLPCIRPAKHLPLLVDVRTGVDTSRAPRVDTSVHTAMGVDAGVRTAVGAGGTRVCLPTPPQHGETGTPRQAGTSPDVHAHVGTSVFHTARPHRRTPVLLSGLVLPCPPRPAVSRVSAGDFLLLLCASQQWQVFSVERTEEWQLMAGANTDHLELQLGEPSAVPNFIYCRWVPGAAGQPLVGAAEAARLQA